MDLEQPWWSLPVADVERSLSTSSDGLSPAEARSRLERFGPNVVREEEVEPWWRIALHQFADPLIYILLVATVVTAALGDYVDAAVILTAVLLNVVVGFVQEFRAREAVRALARMSAPGAEVVREGRTRQVRAEELVPGDVVRLGSGSRVPADLRLASAVGLEIDESALTGESVPARKDPDARLEGTPVAGDQVNLAFAGTVVARGRGRGVVVRTGAETEVGRIAEAVRGVGEVRTPLQETLDAFARSLVWALGALVVLVAGLGALRGMSAADLFITTVALAVSSVPEGLPVVLTVTLAIGMRRMARRRAIVRRLPAVETLGSTTVIASDKTGTLTKNQMTVRRIWAGGETFEVDGTGYGSAGAVRRAGGGGREVAADRHPALAEALRAGVLANEADAAMVDEDGAPLGDPTEVSLLVAAAKAGLDPREVRDRAPALDMLPFEPELKLMATLVRHEDDGRRIYVKGAPEALLERSAWQLAGEEVTDLDPDAVREAADAFAADGLRVLATAYRDVPPDGDPGVEPGRLRELVFVGLQGMDDPVRAEAVESVAAVQRAGIRVLMLTGDHVATARAIGARLGLHDDGARAVEGRELTDLTDSELDGMLDEGVRVFARVAPEHKLRIVERLRARGEVVAVTGDGVNDAPALRAAHIGVAMGVAGTDVAREASDMVLQDDNFATIHSAVEEGRVVFSNVRKVTFFLLSTAVGEVLAIVLALALGWPLPFVAVQILWINLVTNGVQDLALAMEPGEPGLLDRPPRRQGEGVLTWRLVERLGAVGVVLCAGTLYMFWSTLEATGDVDAARSVAMTQMVVFQFFHVFNCRSLERSVFRISPFSNRFLFVSIVVALAAQLAVLHWAPLQQLFRTVPLSGAQWLLVTLIATTIIAGGELDKAWRRRAGRGLA